MKNLVHFISLLIGLVLPVLSYSQTDSIQLRPGPLNGIDCEIRTDSNVPKWWDDDFISNAWTVGYSFLQRSLIKFDLSTIPTDRYIYSAKLSLFCNTISGHHQLHAGANSSYLMRIIEPWEQDQVIWDNQPQTTLEDAVILPQSISQTQDYNDIDVTNLIRYFYNHPESNYGMMIKLIEEYEYAAMVFASSNHIDSTKRPLLEITYSDCNISVSDFTFESTPIQNEIQFYAVSDSATSYYWDFGTGVTSTEQNPIYIFPTSEKYNVCLTTTNDCHASTFCDSVSPCPGINPAYSYNQSEHIVNFFPIQPNEDYEYYWDFDDGFMSDLITPSHYYLNNGTYNVCLTVTSYCKEESSCQLINVIVNSANNNVIEDLIRVSPIPATNMLYISSNNTKIRDIQLFDSKGRLILNNENFTSQLDDLNFSTDVSNIETGIYFLAITTDLNIIKRKVIVI